MGKGKMQRASKISLSPFRALRDFAYLKRSRDG